MDVAFRRQRPIEFQADFRPVAGRGRGLGDHAEAQRLFDRIGVLLDPLIEGKLKAFSIGRQRRAWVLRLLQEPAELDQGRCLVSLGRRDRIGVVGRGISVRVVGSARLGIGKRGPCGRTLVTRRDCLFEGFHSRIDIAAAHGDVALGQIRGARGRIIAAAVLIPDAGRVLAGGLCLGLQSVGARGLRQHRQPGQDEDQPKRDSAKDGGHVVSADGILGRKINR